LSLNQSSSFISALVCDVREYTGIMRTIGETAQVLRNISFSGLGTDFIFASPQPPLTALTRAYYRGNFPIVCRMSVRDRLVGASPAGENGLL
jgi:hypothetical protein